MDKFSVINITSDLDELNNDMYKWSSMPYEFRLRSDENCIRLYGVTNIELYNRLKAVILNKPNIDNDQLIGNIVSEGFEYPDYTTSNNTELLWRIHMAEELNDSPYIALVYPIFTTNIDEGLELLKNLYNKYLLLIDKNKKFSNSYSMNIFGYNVPNMYEIIKNKLLTKKSNETDDTILYLGESNNSIMDSIPDLVDKMLYENDIIGLLRFKLDSCNDKIKVIDKVLYENNISTIDSSQNDFYSEQNLNYIVPFFTLDEINDISLESYNITDTNSYYKTISKLSKEYLACQNINHKLFLETELVNLGWNPSVPINEKTIEYAKQRQIKWLNKYCPTIIDLTKFDIPNKISLIESTNLMKKIYKDNDLYPIYIILTYTGTLFGKIIRKVKKSTYTHAGLALDSNLKNIMTFKFTNFKDQGYTFESLDKYINSNSNSAISVMCVFVDKKTKLSLERSLKYFENIKDKTKYNFGNLINILRNKEKDNDPANESMVCSQFVITLLRLSGIDIMDDNKSSNLVIPQDFQNIKNPKVYKLYEGLAKEYNEKEVENRIKLLFDSKERKQILYSKLIDQIQESYIPANFNYITENENANEILNKINYLLTPESITQ